MVYRNAQFYDEVSPQFLLPAVREVCRLRVSASEWEQDDAMIKLDKSTQDAANRIWEKGRQRQEEIRNFVDENLSKVAQEPQAVPASLPLSNGRGRLLKRKLPDLSSSTEERPN